MAIGGDIAVKLFPWPQLEAREVEIGNPAGFSDAAFVKADVMRATLSLGGLFNGSLDVEMWKWAPAGELAAQRQWRRELDICADRSKLSGRGLLSRVKLDQIQLCKWHCVVSMICSNGHSVFWCQISTQHFRRNPSWAVADEGCRPSGMTCHLA